MTQIYADGRGETWLVIVAYLRDHRDLLRANLFLVLTFATLREISCVWLARAAHRYEVQFNMNAPLGYALLRDRRVSLRPKLMALGAGLVVMGVIQLLQIPFESILAFVLPGVGAAGDVAVDGAEAVIVPVLVATLLMPYLAPQSIVQELRAEHATRV